MNPPRLFLFAVLFTEIVLLSDLQKRIETRNFNCREPVYADVVWSPLPDREHELTFEWIGPSSKVNLTDAHVSIDARDTWNALQLGDNSAFFSRIADPGRGYDEYIGQWNLKVSLDGRLIGTKTFSVGC